MGVRVGNLQKGSENRSHHRPFRINKPKSSMPRFSAVDKILHLQRTIGNRALTRLIQSGALQARLTVGPPNDMYEKEADRVADRVMRIAAPETGCPEGVEKTGLQRQMEKEEEEIQTRPISRQITPLVQRVPEPEEDESLQAKLIRRQAAEEEIQTGLQRQTEEEEPVQAKSDSGRTTAVTSDLESGIRSLKGGGQTLSPASRDFFEPRFGADFSRVRIHTGSSAAHIARSINARAFTTGRDVVFGAGQYSPETPAGKKLLAHELTHVIQQSRADVKHVQSSKYKCITGKKKCAGVHSLRAEFFNYKDVRFWTTDPCIKVQVKISGEWEGYLYNVSGPDYFPIILDGSITKKVRAGHKGGGEYKRTPGKIHTFNFTLKEGRHTLRLSTGGINKDQPRDLWIKLLTKGCLSVR